MTSNKSFRKWAEEERDGVIVTAVLDRLMDHAIVINILVQSCRVKDRYKGEKDSLQCPES